MRNLLKDLLEPYALEAAKKEANSFPPAELVQLLMDIEPEKRVLAFRLLEKNKAAQVFEYLRPEDQAGLTQMMESPEVMGLVEGLEADERVRLFDELPAKVVKRLIANLPTQERETVNILLGYPEGSVGRITNLRIISVKTRATVAQALDLVKNSDLDDNQLEMIFVIDNERHYQGYVRTVNLIKSNPTALIVDVLENNTVAVMTGDRTSEAVRLLGEVNLPAIPVVDSEGRLVGDITFDDVIDLVEEEADETALAQAGVVNLLGRDEAWSDTLVKGSAFSSVRIRIAFLLITLVGGFLVGGIIETFEEVLEEIPAAAVFIPLVMDMGGNVGTQSTTAFARGLAWEQINLNRYFLYIFREARIGILMGLILGSVSGIVAYFWQGIPNEIPQLGMVVGISLALVVTLGAMLGSILPWVMLKLGFDHGPGADPLITTIKDFVGLWIYFSLATWLIGIA
ncbi:MAG: magnesium transporter [Cyanobacterium sp.]